MLETENKPVMVLGDDVKVYNHDDFCIINVKNNVHKLTLNRHILNLTLEGVYSYETEYGILDYEKLVNRLTLDLQSDAEKYSKNKHNTKHPFVVSKFINFNVENVKKRFSKQFHKIWLNIVNKDLEILNFHKKIVSTVGLLRYRYLLNDIERIEKIFQYLKQYPYKDFEKYYSARLSLFQSHCLDFNSFDWRNRISLNRNKFLNLTIDNAKRGTPIGSLTLLPTNLNRQLNSKFEVVFAATVAIRPNTVNERFPFIANQTYTLKDLKKGFKIWSEYVYNLGRGNRFRRKKSSRKASHIEEFSRFLTDFPNFYNGNIVGLIKRSIDYHEALYNRDTNFNSYEKLDEKVETKKPEIELKLPPEIKFLSTVGEVINEGKLMKHCVGNYANEAVHGDVYIFHTEYKNEKATTSVGKNGYIQQSYGPCNQANNASSYAIKILSKLFEPLINQGN